MGEGSIEGSRSRLLDSVGRGSGCAMSPPVAGAVREGGGAKEGRRG